RLSIGAKSIWLTSGVWDYSNLLWDVASGPSDGRRMLIIGSTSIPAANGTRFVKRDDQGKLAGLFVAYAYTPTMFGGHRKWFACPGCRRPARILYGVNSLRCRQCRGLKYASQSEASHWRAQRKALSIRRRVGASGDALDGPFQPPRLAGGRGLHRRGHLRRQGSRQAPCARCHAE